MNCPPLTITFLGTGTSSGVPMIACPCEVCASTDKKDKRLRSSIMVQSETTCIVVDTTPDFRYQMLRENVKKLDAVLYTHPHKDHVAGLDDIRAFNYFNQRAMNIYANEMTQQSLRNEFYYVFAEHKYPGIPDVNLIDIPSERFLVGDIPVEPINVWHMRMPVLGFRFEKITYITDANRIEEEEKEKIKGSEILIINALRHEKHISHFTLGEAIALADELEIPQAYFTHISHQLGKHEDVTAGLPPGRSLAFDGQKILLTGNPL
ncbi:MAG: MBL fold metallo-hydrolase [Ferruginibacter sp.]